MDEDDSLGQGAMGTSYSRGGPMGVARPSAGMVSLYITEGVFNIWGPNILEEGM